MSTPCPAELGQPWEGLPGSRFQPPTSDLLPALDLPQGQGAHVLTGLSSPCETSLRNGGGNVTFPDAPARLAIFKEAFG